MDYITFFLKMACYWLSSNACFVSTLFIEKYVVSNQLHAFGHANNDLIIRAKCFRFQHVGNCAVALLLTCTKGVKIL